MPKRKRLAAEPKPIQMTFRFPEAWLQQIDLIAADISTEWSKASRNDALCYLVSKGMDAQFASPKVKKG